MSAWAKTLTLMLAKTLTLLSASYSINSTMTQLCFKKAILKNATHVNFCSTFLIISLHVVKETGSFVIWLTSREISARYFVWFLNFFSEVCLPAILYSTLFDVITAVSESYFKNICLSTSPHHKMYFLTITLVFLAGFKRVFFYVVLLFRSMICQNHWIKSC